MNKSIAYAGAAVLAIVAIAAFIRGSGASEAPADIGSVSTGGIKLYPQYVTISPVIKETTVQAPINVNEYEISACGCGCTNGDTLVDFNPIVDQFAQNLSGILDSYHNSVVDSLSIYQRQFVDSSAAIDAQAAATYTSILAGPVSGATVSPDALDWVQSKRTALDRYVFDEWARYYDFGAIHGAVSYATPYVGDDAVARAAMSAHA